MTTLLELEDLQLEDFDHLKEERKMGSINHSLVQTRLIKALPDDSYTVATELSLDVSSPARQEILKKYQIKAERELIPDICLYQVNEIAYLDPNCQDDLARTEKIPLLCIEIVSPSQNNTQILRKFRAYFAMGVKSSWYVDPNLKLIRVYLPRYEPTNGLNLTFKSFEEGEVVDPVLNIKVSLNQLFY
jgi:Uma2 family endonuclease